MKVQSYDLYFVSSFVSFNSKLCTSRTTAENEKQILFFIILIHMLQDNSGTTETIFPYYPHSVKKTARGKDFLQKHFLSTCARNLPLLYWESPVTNQDMH